MLCLLPLLMNSKVSLTNGNTTPLASNMYYQQKHGTIPSNMQTSASLVIAKKPTASETELEKYAVENLNKHKKGIFRKPVSLAHMLSWTK
ncbi:rho GTPase-activating protein 39-like, partial [Anneissia japonica]|uniref:rho GTPase-activating protein 39-like n=1 Tax=Anneissia japonica TaxID=1529436 RepID=UPI0014256855